VKPRAKGLISSPMKPEPPTSTLTR
jgi:hypothetical protein